MPTDLSFIRRADSSVFEARLADGTLAGSLNFSVTADGDWRLVHTAVEPAFEGRGVGGFLARATLQAARDAGVQVLPDCSFVAGYIARHTEWADLVPADLRRGYGL